MKRIIVFLLLSCFFIAFATSCSNVKFDINFVVDGVNYKKVSTSGNEVITLPDDPTKEGFTFVGWYWDEGIWEKPFTANSLLDAPLTNNMTVYAYFVENGTDENVTLKFNTMGGTPVEMQTISRGSKPTEPDIPTLEGYYFCGWYLYADFQTIFKFDEPLTANTTIYAKWAKVGNTQLAVNDYQDIVKVEKSISFYDIYRDKNTGRYFVIYNLGTMRNVILGRVTSYSFYNASGLTINWQNTEGWEESITRSVEQSVSHSVTESIEVETGVEEFGLSSSVTAGFSVTVEIGNTFGFSNTRSIMAQVSQGGSQSLDGFEKGRYYDMFVVGNQAVYQYFIYDANGKYEGTAVTAAEISSGLMPLSSVNGIFSYENMPQLEHLDAPDFSMIFASGNGTDSDPYYIDTPAQLFAVNFCLNANYKLASDIELSSFKNNWMPVGADVSNPFTGVLDGGGHTIRNLNSFYAGSSLSNDKAYGIFGYVSGQIKNLKLDNITLEVSSSHDGDGWIYAGALCGAQTGGVITDVSATECSITVHRDQSSNGIIVGLTNGSVVGCDVTNSSIYSNGDGGFIAGSGKSAFITGGKVSGCVISYYAVFNNRSNGGIVGYILNSTVSNCKVSSTTFILDGSSGEMHHYRFGRHYYCPLRPAMGYVVGQSDVSTVYADSFNISGNSIVLKSDADYVGDESADESMYWFRYYDGKVGEVR